MTRFMEFAGAEEECIGYVAEIGWLGWFACIGCGGRQIRELGRVSAPASAQPIEEVDGEG
jgi:hypothetical protein